MRNSVTIVGSGLAALASAIRLNEAGFDVTILEKNKQAGGRLNRLSENGFTFDIGPTFFSMSYEFERFAKECNMKLPFNYHLVDPLYHVHLSEQNRPFILYRDIPKLAVQFDGIEANFETKMQKYLYDTGGLFHNSFDRVVGQNFNSMKHYITQLAHVNPTYLPFLFHSFGSYVNKYFNSAEARQIIPLPSYFLGATPFETNGVYSLLSYTEFVHDGYHNVTGGMYEIVNGLLQEIQRRGISIHYNTEIKDINTKNRRVESVIDQNNKRYEADYFLINMDAALFRGRILQRKQFSENNLAQKKWSMGFLTIYAGLDCKIDQLALHNYYIGISNKDKTMKGFRDNKLPENPYFYVNVNSRYNKQCAPEGCECLMFVIPVPNLLYKSSWEDAPYVVEATLKEFATRIDFPILQHIKMLRWFTPADWQQKYNLYMGAGLGMNHHFLQTGYLRPRNNDEFFSNLFYTGATTVPGIGLPMAIISSRLSTERIINARI